MLPDDPPELNWEPLPKELDPSLLPLSELVPKPVPDEPDENLPLDEPDPKPLLPAKPDWSCPLPAEELDENPDPNPEPDWKRPLEPTPLPAGVKKLLLAMLPDDKLDWELLPNPEFWNPLFLWKLLPLELENEPPCWKKPALASFTATSGTLC